MSDSGIVVGDLLETLPGSLVYQREGVGSGLHTAMLPRVFGLVDIFGDNEQGTLARLLIQRRHPHIIQSYRLQGLLKTLVTFGVFQPDSPLLSKGSFLSPALGEGREKKFT